MERNNTNYPLTMYEYLKNLKKEDTDEMEHQFLIRKYMSFANIRGVLLFHEMGQGKTHIAARLLEHFKHLKCIVIAPTSTFSRFTNEISKLGLTVKPRFISLKASNLANQIENLQDDVDLDDLGRIASLDDSFVVVDEAHNLFNSISNGSKNGISLYDTIMSAKNIRLLFLTGTPIVNDPFELVPAFNMLAGVKLFPEEVEEFNKYFVHNNHIINIEKFKNRIFGLVSYFGDWISSEPRKDRPVQKPIKIIKVPMSENQYAIYSTFRDKEKEENSHIKRAKPERFSKSKSTSTYRIKSRQASNSVGDVLSEDNCPKFYETLNIVNQHKDQPGAIYSNFVHKSGVEDLAELLNANGFKRWYPGKKQSKNTYAVITGDIEEEERTEIQKVASLEGNISGDIIRVVLLGPAAAEGIEFRHFRYMIIMDPFFNAIRTDQAKNRIDRFRSHIDLPKKDQNIQTYIMLAVAPKNINAKEPTTDEHLYHESIKRKALSLEFYKALIEASPECRIYRDKLPKERAVKIKCLMCAPTNEPLFTSSTANDIQLPNPCTELQSEKVKAKELVIKDQKYMYSSEKSGNYTIYHIYKFSDKLNGYVEIDRHDKYYDDIIDHLNS